MKREEIEKKFRKNVSKMTTVGGLNAIACALMATADVMNRSHDIALKQIEKLEKIHAEEEKRNSRGPGMP